MQYNFWSGKIITSGLAVFCLANFSPALGQIVPDNTLPVNSQVTPGCTNCTIEEGTVRGNSLFHSFQEFSIPTGGQAYFNNADQIVNIFSRVTGLSVSTIDGLIRANGTANLFLINPQGIVFGPNARIDVGGAFVASSASSLRFGNGLEFSATNPEAPPLLTINVPIGLGFVDNPKGIESRSVATDLNDNAVGLQVQPGNTLALVGGEVNLDGGNLTARGGRVELGGVSAAGTVGLNSDGSLSFPDDVARADVSIINGAIIDVRAGGGGSITINARNLEVREGSQLLAGIGEGLGTPEAQAGDITINATDTVLFDNESYAFNDVNSESVGNAGDVSVTTGSLQVLNGSLLTSDVVGQGNGGKVTITTGSLEVTNGAFLSASTFGEGDAGSVTINATDLVKFDGEGKDGFPSGAYSFVNSGAEGDAGGVSITTGSLEATNGALIGASTFGEGDAGSVTINATDSVKFEGQTKDGFSGGASSQVNSGAEGDAGGVSITTGSLEVLNGAQLSADILGVGDGGSVTINATDLVKFDGEGKDGSPSGASSQVNPGAEGDAGGVSITTGSLEVTNGAQLGTGTFGKGNGGFITINATDSVKFEGQTKDGFSSGAFGIVERGAVGDAGDISITTGSLEVTNGALLETSTLGEGDAGSITITATDSVKFDGEDKDGFSSAASSQVFPGGVGDAGDVSITTGSLEVTNGAALGVGTFGEGNGGSIIINATDSVKFDGRSRRSGEVVSGASSQVNPGAEGNAGDISINTSSLQVLNGAQVSASTRTVDGQARNLTVTATESVQLSGTGGLSVEATAGGTAGKLTVETGQMSISDGAQVSVSSPEGQAGNLTIGTLTKNEGKKGGKPYISIFLGQKYLIPEYN